MIYATEADWRSAPNRRVAFFGMSGLGKTHVSEILRDSGEWFHYSVDYRIGTAYMGEHINDNLKREAMKVPFLAKLLRTDSIYIGSNITFDNLDPLSTYLGQPGDPSNGGLPLPEYERRQELHVRAEVNALLDTPHFIDRAQEIYGYDNFVCDTGGSTCEVVDAEDPDDPVLTALSQNTLMVWIEGTEDHTQTLIDRFSRAPKPMCYRPTFLTAAWAAHLDRTGKRPDQVDPTEFAVEAYAAAIRERQPRYAAMARNWGVKTTAAEVASVRDAEDVNDLVAAALGRAAARD
ncbi:ATPase [Jannaschia sp. M317]|uniref:ATPase n=1 Tax=Jannaschia sp. M317 TaxID=2867011 RepID=UPI0021A36B65|nr:ATPase [Jannaschia sp. M317]UWQ17013.1 ATPase [Jannaschia sp. M317]